MENLILISGNIGSGKSTLAKYLSTKFESSIILSFATILKDISYDICQLFKFNNIEYEDFYNNKNKEIINEVSIRTRLQTLGTDIIRNKFGKDIFANHIINLCKKQIYYQKNLIIDDWRFINEYEILRPHFKNVITINIQRNEISNAHTSEHDLDNFDFDYIIRNTSNDESFDVDLNLNSVSLFQRFYIMLLLFLNIIKTQVSSIFKFTPPLFSGHCVAPKTKESIGWDIIFDEDIKLEKGKLNIVNSGIKIIDSAGLWFRLVMKSSCQSKVRKLIKSDTLPRIELDNHEGIIDSDYRDFIYIHIVSNVDVIIPKNTSLFQLIPTPNIIFKHRTNNIRIGGFGSTDSN